MSFGYREYQIYRWGERNSSKFENAIKAAVCCPGEKCGDMVAKLAPFLQGVRNCDELVEALRPYFAWLGLRWAYKPCGPPPSVKEKMIIAALCAAGIPLDEEFFRELAHPPEPAEAPAGEEL